MTRAILLVAFGDGLLTLLDAAIKELAPRYHTFQIAFLRFAAGSVWAGALCLYLRPGWPTREAVTANAARSVLVVVTATSFFYALGQLPLAETMALSFLAPLFIALFGAVFLREVINGRIAIALGLGLAGMLVIVGGRFGSAEYSAGAVAGAGAAVVAAISYALVIVLLRARATRDKLVIIVLFQNLLPMFILSVPAAFVWTRPSLMDLGRVALIGMLGVAGHYMLASAFSRAEATRLAPVHYLTLVWGTAFGYVFFGEVPGLTTLLGAVLIVFSTLITRKA